MKRTLILSLLGFIAISEGLPNYKNTELHQCVKCLCHAVSGCYSRLNCATYSISFNYWKRAKSPRVDDNDPPDAESSYKKCISNENCIIATIGQYADSIGHMVRSQPIQLCLNHKGFSGDCNCDGKFDCKDRYAIHFYGSDCGDQKYPHANATRFNRCADGRLNVDTMLDEEGKGCSAELFN